MAWRDSFRPASFRGVAFEATQAKRSLGRQVAIHEYALRDDVEGEDLRLATRTFSFEGLIIGPDYDQARDAFEAALNAPGTGILIHPWLGSLTVRFTKADATESTAEGGCVRYSLECIVEQGASPSQPATDTDGVANAAADGLAAQAQAGLTTQFNVSGRPAFVATAAADVLTQLADRFDAVTAPLKGSGDALSAYVAAGLNLRSQVLDLVTRPADLAAQVTVLVAGIRQLAATPPDALTALKAVLGFGVDLKPVSTATPSRQAQADNQSALVAMVRQAAAAEAIRAVADSDFASYQDAVAVRDDWADAIDTLIDAAGSDFDDDGYAALTAARAALIADVTARGGSLDRLYSLDLTTSVPALVLANRLYGPADIEARAAEIVARNGVAHPGFVPAGTVEVLNV